MNIGLDQQREIKQNSTDREEKTYCFANKERIENGNQRIPWEAVQQKQWELQIEENSEGWSSD